MKKTKQAKRGPKTKQYFTSIMVRNYYFWLLLAIQVVLSDKIFFSNFLFKTMFEQLKYPIVWSRNVL